MAKLKSVVMISLVFLISCGYASASAIGNVPTLNASSAATTEDLDTRLGEYKAGAGFLILATFLLLGEYNIGFKEIQPNSFKQIPEAFEAELVTLKDRMSMLEKVSYQQGKSFRLPSEEETFADSPPLCSDKTGDETMGNYSAGNLNKVLYSIKRSLQFIDSHVHTLNTIEPAFALAAIKAVDDKYGGEFQKTFPISEWISQICSTFTDARESDSCYALTATWKSRPVPWNPESVVHEYGAELKGIGTDNEVIWGRLNGECQLALLTRCEVPYVCERTLFDPTPRSQYMLTHQLLQRSLAEISNCSSAKEFLDMEVNHRLCAKIYKEAQLIHALDAPEILKDLFAEQIGVCGYMGYPNFLREDWLDLIISWQSKSEYGCFVNAGKKEKTKFLTTDKALKRFKTKREEQEGIETNEECLPHFTSVSLLALTSFWDYLESNCK